MAPKDAPAFTPVAALPGIVAAARAAFASGKTRDVAWRKAQLRAIIRAVEENMGAISEALQADLRRPQFEVVVAEALTVTAEARHALAHLDGWVRPRSVATPPGLLPGSSWTKAEPLGVALIVAPWNFPIQLVFSPLVGALAAGNTAVLKPSEVAPACSAVVVDLVRRYLDADAVHVVTGGVPETAALLEQRFDVIMYTGNSAVARVVATAAAKHLTPLILELGGKCPAVVAADADMAVTARRLLASKLLNAGQVCLAPDYVLVEDAADAEARLLAALRAALVEFHGAEPQASASLGRIVNARHWARVAGLLDGCGGTVVAGGTTDRADLYVAPTIVSRPALDSALMRDEIFGPILPVLPVPSLDAAAAFVTARAKPLALYVFSGSTARARAVINATSSGAAVINEAVVQITNCDLPFGGVQESGMGAYHGHDGFRAFSHTKAVYQSWGPLDMGQLRYPPYTPGQLRLVRTLLGSLPQRLPLPGWRDVLIAGLATAVAVLVARQQQQ